ncbi:hypothetical protein D9M69_308910 [compost metagenome]
MVEAGRQHAEQEVTVAVGGGREAAVVGVAEHAVDAGPDQVDGLVGDRQVVGRAGRRVGVRRGVVGGAGGGGGVVPQGAADDPQAGAFAQHVVVQHAGVRADAVGPGALAAGGAVGADAAAAPAGEAFRQAAPGQHRVAAGDGRAVGDVDGVDQADRGADRDAGEVDGQPASGAEADAGRQVARSVGGGADGDADQGVVAAGGEVVGEAHVVGRQAAVLGEAHGHRGGAGGAAGVGDEVGDLLVQPAEAGLDDVFEQRGAGGAGGAVDHVVHPHAEGVVGLVADHVVDPCAELEDDAFQVVIVAVAVGDAAQVDGHHLVAVAVRGDRHEKGIEDAGGGGAGQVRREELRLGAVLVAEDHQRATGDHPIAETADQAAVGNERDAHAGDVGQAQPVVQGDDQLVVGVVALGDQHRGAVADDLADGDVLVQRIGGVGRGGVRQPADPRDLGALGHRDDQHAAEPVVVERALIEQAVLPGAFARRVGHAVAAAVQAGPAYLGEVVERRHRGAVGVHHAGDAEDDAAALGDVEVAVVDQGAPRRVEGEAGADVGADAADGVDRADQDELVEFAGQDAVEADVEGIEVAGAVTVGDGDGVLQRVAFIEAQARRRHQFLAELQGRLLQGHHRLAAGQVDVAVQRGAAVGRVAVGVAVGQPRVVLQHAVGLVVRGVAGDQAQADDEAVVAGDVVGGGAGDGEGQPRIDAVVAQGAGRCAQRAGGGGAYEVGAQHSAGAGDQLVAQAAVETGVQAQAGRDQVVDAQALGGALGEGDEDVVEHALADYQVGAGGVRGA